MSERKKILSIDYDVELPKQRGKRSDVDWVGTVKGFYESGKEHGQPNLGEIVKPSTAIVNFRHAIEEADLKDKVAVVSKSHLDGKKRIVEAVYLKRIGTGVSEKAKKQKKK